MSGCEAGVSQGRKRRKVHLDDMNFLSILNVAVPVSEL